MFDSYFPSIDLLIVECNIDNKVLIVVVVYIPDKLSITEFEQFFEMFEQVPILIDKKVCIVSEFNSPMYVNESIEDGRTYVIMNFLEINEFKLYSHLTNANMRLLDLVITNRPCAVTWEHTPLVTEDTHHPAITVSVKFIGTKTVK